MDSEGYKEQVDSHVSDKPVLIIENRQLKTELKSMKNVLQQVTLERDIAKEVIMKYEIKCTELAEENVRLKELMSHMQIEENVMLSSVNKSNEKNTSATQQQFVTEELDEVNGLPPDDLTPLNGNDEQWLINKLKCYGMDGWWKNTFDDCTVDDSMQLVCVKDNRSEPDEDHMHFNTPPSIKETAPNVVKSKSSIGILASFECYACKKNFKSKYALLRHYRSHTGEGLIFCKYPSCKQSFTAKHIFVNHMRIHTGEKPFQCDFFGCCKRYTQKCTLTKHKRLHTGDKPYICKQFGCEERFRLKYQLLTHNQEDHLII